MTIAHGLRIAVDRDASGVVVHIITDDPAQTMRADMDARYFLSMFGHVVSRAAAIGLPLGPPGVAARYAPPSPSVSDLIRAGWARVDAAGGTGVYRPDGGPDR